MPKIQTGTESSPSDGGSVGEKKAEVATETTSVAESLDTADQWDELDPVKLKKAFRFATWSSIGLVRFIPFTAFLRNADSLIEVYRPYSSDTSASLWISTCI